MREAESFLQTLNTVIKLRDRTSVVNEYIRSEQILAETNTQI